MIMQTDIGPFTIGYRKDELVCDFGEQSVDKEPTKKLAQQVRKYFDGSVVNQFDAPISDGPPFMQKCWAACRDIPYGATITYKELAKAAGSPKAIRAAGQAMRRNPTPIITPCHRVIASSGKLHGFAGKTNPNSKELRIKSHLLSLEQFNFKRV
jgi:methylated-DNA-[protein]-cysteine S-methyltransferase